MKSITIKTNNTNILEYLLNELESSDICDISFLKKAFLHYDNIIIHYLGSDNSYFISKISLIMSFLVIDELEEDILIKYLNDNYFYFNRHDLSKILSNCFEILAEDFSNLFDSKFNLLNKAFFNYFSENKSLIISGFINFRLKDYFRILDNLVTEAVTRFIVEKEYLEFISMLKSYIKTKTVTNTCVNLIYSSNESTLLDENMKLILNSKSNLNCKFLSDISFSSNDYTLNSLLSIVPSNIVIHLLDGAIDEFINTLLLVFGNRVTICTNCSICNSSENINNKTIHTKIKDLNI